MIRINNSKITGTTTTKVITGEYNGCIFDISFTEMHDINTDSYSYEVGEIEWEDEDIQVSDEELEEIEEFVVEYMYKNS